MLGCFYSGTLKAPNCRYGRKKMNESRRDLPCRAIAFLRSPGPQSLCFAKLISGLIPFGMRLYPRRPASLKKSGPSTHDLPVAEIVLLS